MSVPGPPTGTARCHVFVSGRVQGVGFRASCARRAVEAGVAGWVRNTGDGRVEAVFEGPSPAVDAVVAWCRRGPPVARVSGVEVVAEEPAGAHGFSVR